jgi:spore coat polysaccharide biosynthesis protein SpsF (cytidylyltransferase family)
MREVAAYATTMNVAYRILAGILKQIAEGAGVKSRRLELKVNRSLSAHRSVVECIRPMLSMSILDDIMSTSKTTEDEPVLSVSEVRSHSSEGASRYQY